MRPGSILLLFDIDGTLIHSRGAGVRGMNHAFADLYGWHAALDDVPIAGRTDRAIVSEVFGRHGIEPDAAAVSRVRDAYLSALPHELAGHPPSAFLLPSVVDTLDALVDDGRFTVALLTGNFEKGARLKLEAAEVWGRFTFGAYGDDFVNRRDLVPVACGRATALGAQADAVIVIGDTPLDVDCARAHGALAVGVATGHYDVQALAAAGADLVVETLEALRPVTATLAALPGR